MKKSIRNYTINSAIDGSRITLRLIRCDIGLVWINGDLVWGEVCDVCPPANTVAEAMENAAAIWPNNSAWRGQPGNR